MRLKNFKNLLAYYSLITVVAPRLNKPYFFNYPSQVLFSSCEQAFPARPHTDNRDTVGPDSILTVVVVVVVVVVDEVLDGVVADVSVDGVEQLTILQVRLSLKQILQQCAIKI